MVFVLITHTQTVSHFFPKVCAPLQKKLWDRNRNRYQPGLKALRLCLVDAISRTCSRRSVGDAGNRHDTGASHSEAATAQCCEVAVYLPGGAESACYNILPACILLVLYYETPARYDSRSSPAQFAYLSLKVPEPTVTALIKISTR